MKRALCIISFLLYADFIFGQELKSLPDCKDMKEKIVMIQKSFDKLFETFRNNEPGKDTIRTTYTTQITYSSAFRLCDEPGNLIYLKGSSWKTFEFDFYFKSSNYDFDDRMEFSKRADEILAVLKQVFEKWYANRTNDWDDDGKLSIYYFTDGDPKTDDIKKEVRFTTFAEGDYITYYRLIFTLK